MVIDYFFIQYKPDVEATELALAFPISLDFSNTMLAKVLTCLYQMHSVYTLQGCRQVGAWGGFNPPPPTFLSSNYTLYMGMAEIVKILSKMHLNAKKYIKLRPNY